jgi:hypothetical protein
METTDRDGNPWKVYASGDHKTLCAQSRPYHRPRDIDGNKTSGPCECERRFTKSTTIWEGRLNWRTGEFTGEFSK